MALIPFGEIPTFVKTNETMDSQTGIDAIFQYATEGILVTNQKSEIININPSALKLFGYEKAELLGQKIEILIPNRFKDKHVSNRNQYQQSPRPRAMGKGLNLMALKSNGVEFPVEISLSPYETDHGKFVVAFVIDITNRKQIEEQLKHYSTELEKQVHNRTLILQEAITELEKTKNELKETLEKEIELNELKSRFVSMASHEFRTPLATILTSLSLVKTYGEKQESEKQEKHIQKIKNSINNLTDILEDFLSVSKLEEGKIQLLRETIDIHHFIHDTIQELKPFCKVGQQIKYQHVGNPIVNLDKKLFKHILYNLLSNAIKFSNENSSISINTESDSNKFYFKISDQGIGISEKEQKNLFQRFFRAKNASNIQGTGLGLNIVENYLELMNGTIHFESQENIGTTFYVTIPQ